MSCRVYFNPAVWLLGFTISWGEWESIVEAVNIRYIEVVFYVPLLTMVVRKDKRVPRPR